jgi:hypothetical protein
MVTLGQDLFPALAFEREYDKTVSPKLYKEQRPLGAEML